MRISLATDIPAAEVEQFAKRVKQQLLTQDWNALAEELSYPITVDGVTYNSREEFLAADFETELNPYFFVELVRRCSVTGAESCLVKQAVFGS